MKNGDERPVQCDSTLEQFTVAFGSHLIGSVSAARKRMFNHKIQQAESAKQRIALHSVESIRKACLTTCHVWPYWRSRRRERIQQERDHGMRPCEAASDWARVRRETCCDCRRWLPCLQAVIPCVDVGLKKEPVRCIISHTSHVTRHTS